MKLERARKLKIGDTVYFPADRGELAGNGMVTHIGEGVQSHPSVPEGFLWITVELPGGKSRHVWSSNRLS